MVTFNEDIPYSEAMKKGRAQDKAVLNLISDKLISEGDDLNEVLKKVQNETNAILEENNIAGLK